MEAQTMLQVVQAYDRAYIVEVPTDDGASLETKLDAAYRVFQDRDGWLKPHDRIAILCRLAALVGGKTLSFGPSDRLRGRQAVARRDGGRNRAVDGIGNAADELRNLAGHKIPMGADRRQHRSLGFHD
jgi:hypothetical protein